MSDEIVGFSGHTLNDVYETFKSIKECSLQTEVFDAFLAEYARTKDLGKARFYAMCEWDC